MTCRSGMWVSNQMSSLRGAVEQGPRGEARSAHFQSHCWLLHTFSSVGLHGTNEKGVLNQPDPTLKPCLTVARPSCLTSRVSISPNSKDCLKDLDEPRLGPSLPGAQHWASSRHQGWPPSSHPHLTAHLTEFSFQDCLLGWKSLIS